MGLGLGWVALRFSAMRLQSLGIVQGWASKRSGSLLMLAMTRGSGVFLLAIVGSLYSWKQDELSAQPGSKQNQAVLGFDWAWFRDMSSCSSTRQSPRSTEEHSTRRFGRLFITKGEHPKPYKQEPQTFKVFIRLRAITILAKRF